VADVLLIQTPNVTGTFFNLTGKEVPLSLCYLAAYLRERGHCPAICDLDLERNPEETLRRTLHNHRPQLVGFSSYTPNVELAAMYAAMVKRDLPSAAIALGGFHASALPEQTLYEFSAFDYIVAGEGEQTLVELVEVLQDKGDLSSIRGLAYRREDSVCRNEPRPLIEDLDSFPFPARDLIQLARYVPDPGNYWQLPSSGILYSRGCPYHCAFCSKSVFNDRIRYRRVECFIAEVNHCIDRHGIHDFRLEDEAPTINIKRMQSLCEAILANGRAITWNCYSRVDTIDEPTLRLMRRAGCHHITYGIESALPATLARIDKKLDPVKAAETVLLTKQVGIECKANFIIGFPWETADDMREVVRYAKRISPDLVTFNLFKPLPGSRLYDELHATNKLQHGRWQDYFTTGEKLLFPAEYSEDEALRILENAVFSFYFRPRFLMQRLQRMLAHPGRELKVAWQGLSILLRELLLSLMKQSPLADGRRANR